MARSVVGLLAAVGAAFAALVGLSHGEVVWVILAAAAVATGLAAYLALPASKKSGSTAAPLQKKYSQVELFELNLRSAGQ